MTTDCRAKEEPRSSPSDPRRTAGPDFFGTNLERAGDHNQRVTMHAIRVNGPVTRTDIASMTALTPAAVANITNWLLQDRFILPAG